MKKINIYSSTIEIGEDGGYRVSTEDHEAEYGDTWNGDVEGYAYNYWGYVAADSPDYEPGEYDVIRYSDYLRDWNLDVPSFIYEKMQNAVVVLAGSPRIPVEFFWAEEVEEDEEDE